MNAKKIKKNEPFGPGGLIRAVGFFLLVAGMLFTNVIDDAVSLSDAASFAIMGTTIVLGLVMVAFGTEMARKLACSECGNPATKESRICPACREPFDD